MSAEEAEEWKQNFAILNKKLRAAAAAVKAHESVLISIKNLSICWAIFRRLAAIRWRLHFLLGIVLPSPLYASRVGSLSSNTNYPNRTAAQFRFAHTRVIDRWRWWWHICSARALHPVPVSISDPRVRQCQIILGQLIVCLPLPKVAACIGRTSDSVVNTALTRRRSVSLDPWSKGSSFGGDSTRIWWLFRKPLSSSNSYDWHWIVVWCNGLEAEESWNKMSREVWHCGEANWRE